MTDLERVLQLIETLEERVKIAEAVAELAIRQNEIMMQFMKGDGVCQVMN